MPDLTLDAFAILALLAIWCGCLLWIVRPYLRSRSRPAKPTRAELIATLTKIACETPLPESLKGVGRPSLATWFDSDGPVGVSYTVAVGGEDGISVVSDRVCLCGSCESLVPDRDVETEFRRMMGIVHRGAVSALPSPVVPRLRGPVDPRSN